MKLKPMHESELIQRISTAPFVIYGMGYVGGIIADWCSENGLDYVFCDQNAEQKRERCGKTVISPEELASEYPDAVVVVASINYYDEISRRLEQLGISRECVLSYLAFWPEKTDWEELEETADWANVRQRAEIFAAWIDSSAKSVGDYSREKNFLREFLQAGVQYTSPDYIRFQDNIPYADFSGMPPEFFVDTSFCMAMLMSFRNPEDLITYLCTTTKKTIIISYVGKEMMPDIRFRRSINYNNDYTEQQLLDMFEKGGFLCRRTAQDPFDAVHTVYLLEKQ